MEQENIIQIRQRDIHAANEAFSDFMSKTENYLNEKALSTKGLYQQCSGTELETVALGALHEIAPSTPFRKEDILLVSGAKFPDIQAGVYYGVEVKSTKTDSWTSTGSSIVESTRIKEVESIYMLFGKLGGEHAEFRCRPYEQCLSNIAVTHSPRYLIDMNLEDTVFDKMKVEYNTFRLLEETEKIAKVRDYYKKVYAAKGKGKTYQMPWWMGGDDSDQSSSIMIRFYRDLEVELKQEIVARMFVLFPELFSNSGNKYKRASLWMCSRYSVIDNCMRDKFTAGGKVDNVGGVEFEHPVPQIINTLYASKDAILSLLNNPDAALVADINDFWETECNPIFYRHQWAKMIQATFNDNPQLSFVNIEELLSKWK